MSEAQSMKDQKSPNTRTSLARELSLGGLKTGHHVIVHSSLSSLGWVCGGPVAVIQALMDVVGKEGTIIMPMHSSDLSDPSEWCNPPVPESWWESIRQETPAFHPLYTPSRGMGVIPETFRSYPGTIRSNHPQLSFCANGKLAREITMNHSLEFAMGEESPLQNLYNRNGYILLLGVDHSKNTSFHLGESKAKVRKVLSRGAPVFEDGERVWKNFDDYDYDDTDFKKIGENYEISRQVKPFKVGMGWARLLDQVDLVDYSKEYFLSKV